MNRFPIPDGWVQVRRCLVEAGDKIRSETGWELAERLGRGGKEKSVVGHPTSLYECVIRKINQGKTHERDRENRGAG